MIRQQLDRLRASIARSCSEAGHGPVTLVAVTKGVSIDAIKDALSAGISDIAENYIQEAQRKYGLLRGYRLTRHFIGHLQSNKVQYAVKLFDCIQSVDSCSIAQAIDRQAQKLNKIQDVLIQVNSSAEQAKSGVSIEGAPELLACVKKLANVRVRGLMTMAPYTDDRAVIRNCFRRTRALFNEMNAAAARPDRLTVLSMGMTDDYLIAIQEGATMLRIGRAIFGERT